MPLNIEASIRPNKRFVINKMGRRQDMDDNQTGTTLFRHERGRENLPVVNTCVPSLFGMFMWTITLWRLSMDHRTLMSHAIGVWCRPSGFGVAIAPWSPFALWSPTYILVHTINIHWN
jgi:hypothetical protein